MYFNMFGNPFQFRLIAMNFSIVMCILDHAVFSNGEIGVDHYFLEADVTCSFKTVNPTRGKMWTTKKRTHPTPDRIQLSLVFV